MPFDPDKPYNDLPLLPPRSDLETKAVLRKAIAANKALAELKGAGELIPNQAILIKSVSGENDMSKKSSLLDTFLGNVQAVDVFDHGRGDPPVRTNWLNSICSNNEPVVKICRKKPFF